MNLKDDTLATVAATLTAAIIAAEPSGLINPGKSVPNAAAAVDLFDKVVARLKINHQKSSTRETVARAQAAVRDRA